MYEANQTTAKREKQPELTEAHMRFQELGGRLDKCLSRLVTVGNRIVDESSNVRENDVKTEPTQYMPGLVQDFNHDIQGFSSLISRIEREVQKLESNI